MLAPLSQLLPPPPPSDPIPWGFVFGLALTFALGQVLASFYERYARVGSDRRKLARLFPLIAATTMLVIFVVKSSIALSLGLVGALSIVRFRTPIKEPEELIYLFIAIATGIGIGAGATTVTLLSIAGILLFLFLRERTAVDRPSRRLHVHVRTELRSDRNATAAFQSLLEIFERLHPDADVRRVDAGDGSLDVSVLLDLEHASALAPLMEAVETAAPGSSVSVVEALSLE